MYRDPDAILELIYANRELRIIDEPRCGFCGLPARNGGGAINEIAGHWQTYCCRIVVSPCCEGAPQEN